MVDDDAVSLLWAFCKVEHSEFQDKAEALQRVACAAIRLEFSKHDIDPAELLEEGHVFTRHFKPAGLEVLAAAADHVRLSRPGSASGVTQDRSTQATQAQPQLRAMNKGTNTGQVQIPESCDTGLVPTAMYGKAMNSPWRTNWPQQTATHHVPDNGAHDLPQFGFGRGSMTMGPGAIRLQDGSIPQVSGLYVGPSIDVSGASNGHPPDFAVRTSEFQETNMANCETSGQAHSPRWPQCAPTTNSTYDQALHSSLAQLGDDTTEYGNSLDWDNLVKNLYNDIGEGL